MASNGETRDLKDGTTTVMVSRRNVNGTACLVEGVAGSKIVMIPPCSLSFRMAVDGEALVKDANGVELSEPIQCPAGVLTTWTLDMNTAIEATDLSLNVFVSHQTDVTGRIRYALRLVKLVRH